LQTHHQKHNAVPCAIFDIIFIPMFISPLQIEANVSHHQERQSSRRSGEK